MSMEWIRKTCCAAALAALALALVPGCSDSDSDDEQTGQALSVAGQWTLTAEGMFAMTLNLTHAGTTIGGTVTDAENYAVRVTGSSVSPAGTTDGSRALTLIVTFSDGQVATFNGTVSGDNDSMSGAYSTNWGGADSWSARR